MKRHLLLAAGLVMAASWMVEVEAQERAGGMGKEQQATDSGIQSHIDTYLPKFKSADKKIREDSVLGLHKALQSAWNTRGVFPQGATRKQLTQELSHLYTQSENSDFTDAATRARLIYDLARYGDNEVAKPIILRVLDRGSRQDRFEALRGLGSPGGVSGEDLYKKIEELAGRGVITKEAAATYLSRIDKERALTKILQELRTTRDKRTFVYRAWTLQNTYRRPEDFKEILPRINEFGLTKSKSFDGRSDGIFWIDAGLLASYVDMATGADLKLALKMMAQHSLLTRPESSPPLIRLLESPEPEIRILAAQALEQVSGYSLSDKKSINTALQRAIRREEEFRTKSALQTSADRITSAEKEWLRILERRKGSAPK